MYVLFVLLARDYFERAEGVRAVLGGAVYVVAAAACLQRHHRRTDESPMWLWLAMALLVFELGTALSFIVVEESDPSPTLADYAWLVSYLGLYAAVFASSTFAAGRADGQPRGWDGLAGSASIGALAWGLAYDRVVVSTDGAAATVATNLAYPVADLVLLMTLIAVSHLAFWASTSKKILGAALGVLLVTDVAFLWLIAEENYDFEPELGLAYTVYAVGVGTAAAVRDRGRPAPAEPRVGSGLLSLVYVGICLVTLTYGQFMTIPSGAAILALVGLLIAGFRLAASIRRVAELTSAHREARTDHLTGLPNRRRFTELLDEVAASCDRAMLAILDLDQFKQINDALGHAIGDDVLADVAADLERSTPPRASLSRLGGDEFALLLPGYSSAEAVTAVERILQQVAVPRRAGDIDVTISASAGLAAYPEHASRPPELTARADIAMYKSKRHGNRVTMFAPDEQTPTVDSLRTTAELRQALADDALTLHYQVQVRLADRRPCGYEALVRWNHPELGLVGAPAILQFARSAGLGPELTAFVIRRTISDAESILSANGALAIAFNVTPADLTGDHLLPNLRRALDRSGIDPRCIVVELTEEAVMDDREQGQRQVAALRDLGVGVALDDFGTGQSSLAYVADLPITQLKMDRSIVAGTTKDARHAAIAIATLSMARSLGIEVVAEGVEDEETTHWLIDHRCDVGQGYYFGRPGPTEVVHAPTD